MTPKRIIKIKRDSLKDKIKIILTSDRSEIRRSQIGRPNRVERYQYGFNI